MKTAITFLISCLLLCSGVDAADIAGNWTKISKNSANRDLRLVFKIYRNTDGTLSSAMDSPDQGVKDIPADNTEFKDGEPLMNGFFPCELYL